MTIKFLFAATIVVATAGPAAPPAWPAASDYVFEPVEADVKAGAGQEIAVRLVHKPGGHPVPGAVIFQTRLDMSPDAMAEMTGAIKPLEPGDPGIYRFKADLTMAGRWALSLAAKVQGEPETVKATVVFRAKE